MDLPKFLLVIWASFFHVIKCGNSCDPDFGIAPCGNITLPDGRSIQLVPTLVSPLTSSEPVIRKLRPSWRHLICTLPEAPTYTSIGPSHDTSAAESSTETSPETITESTTDTSPGTATDSSSATSSETTTIAETLTAASAEGSTVPSVNMTASSCKMLYSMGHQTSDVYTITPNGVEAIDVYCDMGNGGWTVFQKRYDGSVDFYRNYAEYVHGFGNFSGEYWLGLNNIYLLAKDGVELRIDMMDYSNNHVYALYGNFSIGSPMSNYQLTFSSYSGSANEGLSAAKDQGFTTYDSDNDASAGANCAKTYQGAWWYNNCYTANLNGVYSIQNDLRGIVWNWPQTIYMKSTEMKLRACC